MARTRLLILTLLILGHLTLDLFVPACPRHIPAEVGPFPIVLLAIPIGVWLSQFVLIAVWGTLVAGPVALRIPWAFFLATLMWLALVAGNRWLRDDIYAQYFSAADVTGLGLMFISGLGIVSGPLAIARSAHRWRLQTSAAPENLNLQKYQQFSLGQLLFAVALFAISLGLGRMVIPPSDHIAPEITSMHVVAVIVFVAISVCLVLPWVWIAFAPRRRWPWLAFVWIFFAGFVSVLQVACFALLFGNPNHDAERYLRIFFTQNMVQCASVFLTFALLRTTGLQLRQIPLPDNAVFGP